MTKFVNCTPHAITVEGLGTFPASGTVARVEALRKELPNGLGCRVIRQVFGEVTGLPDPEPADGTVYIVSALVLGALNGSRIDVVAPDTGPDAVRENGQIVAVRGFVC